ncbi:MAG TPA: hypothetical protein VFI68_15240 [Anaerolineales bacterium]|nr:hypothetical protein [Anaerolineales bacterium]
MNKRTLLTSFVLLFAVLACNLPGQGDATQAPEAPVITETSALPLDTPIPTFTSAPTNTPLPTLTPTPTIPIAWPLDKGVNCRFGPGIEWATIGALLVGQTATIQGKNSNGSWWYVTTQNDPGKPCWVAASVTLTAGNLLNLPIVNSPFASVTNVSVKLDPKEINLALCMVLVPPITIQGTIETNGPTLVKYYFETEQGGQKPIEQINFNSADSKIVETTYTPPGSAGSFWVRLIIVSPNDKVGEAKYKVVCP